MTSVTKTIANELLDLDAAHAAFERDGFLIVPNALEATQVLAVDAAFKTHLARHPEDWANFSESFITAPDVLPRTDAFDGVIENARMFALLERLIGPDLAFEELALMQRKPTDNVGELKGWHRDIIRAYERRHEIDAISVVYYLTDVGPDDHCFSIVPGTHGPGVDMRTDDVQPGMEFDALGAAGSAFVFHARCIHAGKLKLGSRERRTIHLYFGHAATPRTSEWTEIPQRLAERHDPRLPPKLYAKAATTASVDGVGRRPRDLPAGLSTAEQLIHVQRAANRRPEVAA
ncbi:MAG: phytanoyl-CoA dioxygenase family protein [Rhodoferax sp.]|nr:phytanoyl-CoA dioxygenase family protein [Rhodoferax sp.]